MTRRRKEVIRKGEERRWITKRKLLSWWRKLITHGF